MCETKLGEQEVWDIKGYEAIPHNYKRGQEGLIVAARVGTFVSLEKISDSHSNILSVQIVYPDRTFRIIVCHGPQEDDESEVRQDFFDNIAVEIERGRAADETPIVFGDMNAKIVEQNGNIIAESFNGKMFTSMIEVTEMKVANFHEKTIGKWTRIQNSKKGTAKSVLDYILMEEQLMLLVNDITIDEEKCNTPYRLTKYKKGHKITFTDHCAMFLSLDCPKGKVKPRSTKRKVWNLTQDGYDKFKEESDKKVNVEPGCSTDQYFQNWSTSLLTIMGRCFLKKTIGHSKRTLKLSNGRKNIRRILQLEAKGGKVQRAVVKKYFDILRSKEIIRLEQHRANTLRRTASLLTEEERFSPQGYWKLKKSVTSGKAQPKLTSVVCNDKVEVIGESLIVEEYRKEFQFRLRNRTPHPEWEQYTANTNQILAYLLDSQYEQTPLFTMEELSLAISKLKKGKCPGPDELPAEIFINAGKGILEELLKVLNQIKETKEIPDQWNWVDITTIYKNKGSKKELINYRGIFITLIVKKIFENMIKERMKDNLEKVDKNQGGSRTNRSPPDNLFLLYGCIDHQKYKNKPLFITAYDFEQAFDALWLQDSVLSLERIGVPTDILHIIYNLNKQAKITVKTPYGRTRQTVLTDIVEQGTVLGPILCSTSTAEYCGSNVGVAVLDAVVSSLVWVDDTLDLSVSTDNAEESHKKAILFGRKKKIPYSKTKCKTMVVNGKKNDQPPQLYIEEAKVELVQLIEYLGDVINSKGDYSDLVKDRVKRGVSAMVRIEALVRETGLGVHTVSVYLLLYQALFLSCITFNSQAWSNIKEADLDQLEKLQLRCLKKILQLPRSTANSFVFLEFGELPIRYIIDRNQLTFLYHVYHLQEDDPVRIMWEMMKKLPGEKNWWGRVKGLLTKYQISMDHVKTMAKSSYKKLVKERVKEVALNSLREQCREKIRTRSLSYSSLNTQSYLQELYPNQAKAILQCRSKTLDIKEHRQYMYKDMVCRLCNEADETLDHVVNCGCLDKIDTSVLYSDNQEFSYEKKVMFTSIATRINRFMEEVKEK